MGAGGIEAWQNDPVELPDADKWNDNGRFINLVQRNLLRNGDFEKSFVSGVPDFWALSGTGAAAAEDADEKHGDKAVKITYGSADSYLTGVSAEFAFHQGKQVKAWCYVKCSTPDIARIKLVDGVGTAASDFHTGGGTYELLEVTLDVAGGATKLELELHVEAAGNAIFDVAVMVDFDGVRGWIPSDQDLAPTKEVFWHTPYTADNNIGDFPSLQVATDGNSRVSFYVPQDFKTLVSCALVVIPDATAGPQTVQLTSDYGAVGQAYNVHSESDLINTYSYTANQIKEVDLADVLTGIAAGDYVGVAYNRLAAAMGNWEVLGVRLKYT